jgi:hypothetical protein
MATSQSKQLARSGPALLAVAPIALAPLQAAFGPPTWIWAALMMAGFVGLTIGTMALVRFPARRRPPPFVAPAEAAAEAARRELDAIARDGLIDRGELRDLYRRVGACLRGYLARRFDVPAAAMTPPEVKGRLEASAAERSTIRLAVDLLERCEAAQSTGQSVARERAEADLSSAFEVVALSAQSGQAAQRDGRGKGAH